MQLWMETRQPKSKNRKLQITNKLIKIKTVWLTPKNKNSRNKIMFQTAAPQRTEPTEDCEKKMDRNQGWRLQMV